MDGTPTLRMNEFMLATLGAGKVDLAPVEGGELFSFCGLLGFVLQICWFLRIRDIFLHHHSNPYSLASQFIFLSYTMDLFGFLH